jgi:hypothetical protein
MKIAGMVLGIVGAVIGLALSIIILVAGASIVGVGPFGLDNAFIILGVIDVVACVIALVGAAISMRASIAGGVMMIVIGAAGFVLFAPLFWSASGVLLVTGGSLAIAGRGRRPVPYQPAGFGPSAMAAPMAPARMAIPQNQPYQRPAVGGWNPPPAGPAARPQVAGTTAGLGVTSSVPQPARDSAPAVVGGAAAAPAEVKPGLPGVTAAKPFAESEHVLAVQKALLEGQPAQAAGGVTGPASAFEGASPFRLAFLEGSGRAGEMWTLPKGREVHVGRDESCFVMLTDGKASRQHALLSHRADGLYITDLSSSNGTRVNEERLGAEAKKLSAGDKIRIGDTVLEVKI